MDGGTLRGGAGGDELGPGADVDALVGALTRWSGDQRLLQRAGERSRQRWLHQQALEDSTLRGVLVALAESHAEVSLRTTGRHRHGRLGAVATGLCVLEDRTGRATLLRLDSLVAVETAAGPTSGRRTPELVLEFSDALAALAAEMVPVQLDLGDTQLSGELAGVGEDVVILRSPATARPTLYVPLRRVEACTLR